MSHQHCQFDWIWNYLGDMQLGMSVGEFPERFSWGAKTRPEYGERLLYGQGSQAELRESKLSTSIHLSLLPDHGCHGNNHYTHAPGHPCLDGPHPKAGSQNKAVLSMCLCQVLFRAMRTGMGLSPSLCSVSLRGRICEVLWGVTASWVRSSISGGRK